MNHQLAFIKSQHIANALKKIDAEEVPKDHQWSEYWICYRGKLYQFMYTVQLASTFTSTPLKPGEVHSNDSSRRYIEKLGYHVLFKSAQAVATHVPVKYWAGAYLFGVNQDQNMLDDFTLKNRWATDHNLAEGEGAKIYRLLRKVKINDRICVRALDRKNGIIQILKVGTVTDTSLIATGELGVQWDYNPPLFRGSKPAGVGAGNWWNSLIQVKREDDIDVIFPGLPRKRIARLAWNSMGWMQPSGPSGKSTDSSTHEGKHGYGHEEWLFDTNRLLNGYHYGFLEPVRRNQQHHAGATFDVWLYTMNRDTKKRYWVGEITNLMVLTEEEAKEVEDQYRQNGWLAEMEREIKASGADESGFSHWKGVKLFNVKFMPEELVVNEPYIELAASHPVVEHSRYNFSIFKEAYQVTEDQEDDFAFMPSTATSSAGVSTLKTSTYLQPAKRKQIKFLHKLLSDELAAVLRIDYGAANVTQEHPGGYNSTSIDIVVNTGSGLTFYEIKTYPSVRVSIREALGQIMEYCYFHNKVKASTLVIVTHQDINLKTKQYLQHLRTTLKLPIYYQYFNRTTQTLSSRY
ncbi:hypothetical protein SAMN06265337_4239 [Hymenobacter gelipurpurascens]|uniref:Uncharacterized protein n=1 Tax=Hymenobacter gelipurpurascens TaxID=89968 RepID=A0A212UHI6_9BACT|nr:hypothetical protein [Hymenobacter gelipurpurascens]SNC77640.1 hypothetical protein SAMN06265337_4239 [Hymenobacter gelipurpurascens]